MSLEPIWKSEAATDADARELAWARKEIARLKDELAQQSNSKKSLAQQIRPLLEKVGRKVKGLIP
jgi:septal ring factor EnvC (AmiA/AmiB activator)